MVVLAVGLDVVAGIGVIREEQYMARSTKAEARMQIAQALARARPPLRRS